MTIRRYAPLALAALAVACKPEIDQRTNTTTAEYVVFDPSNSRVPLPNTIVLQSFLSSDPGPGALPCSYFLPADTQTAAICAYARAGGWPTATPITIDFVTGTLAGDGEITYTPSPLDPTSLVPAGLANPTFAVVDVTNPAAPNPAYLGTPSFDAASGRLTLPPPGGLGTDWAGKSYVVIVKGGADGVKTVGTDPYLAMPTLYILREAVLADLDLQVPENQTLFPGTPEEKAAAGAQLEPLRAAFHEGLLPLTLGLQGAGIDLPFAELVSMQSFTLAPGGTVTIGEGTDPAPGTLANGATAAIDAFTVQSSVATATLVAVVFDMTGPTNAIAALSVNAAPDCGAATALSAATPPAASGPTTILLGVFPSATQTAATPLWVCATAAAGAGTVSGNVVTVSAFTGTGYTAVDQDASSVNFTVN